MDKASKILIAIGVPTMVIGLILMFNVLGIEWLTFPGVALTLIGAFLAWIGYGRAKGIIT